MGIPITEGEIRIQNSLPALKALREAESVLVTSLSASGTWRMDRPAQIVNELVGTIRIGTRGFLGADVQLAQILSGHPIEMTATAYAGIEESFVRISALGENLPFIQTVLLVLSPHILPTTFTWQQQSWSIKPGELRIGSASEREGVKPDQSLRPPTRTRPELPPPN
jgi:hypothetical protein